MTEETAVRIATSLERHVEQQEKCITLQTRMAESQAENVEQVGGSLKLRMVELRFAIMRATDAVRGLPERVDEYTKLLAELESPMVGA